MRELKFRVWNKADKSWTRPNILEVWDESGKLEPFKYLKTGKLTPIYSPIEDFIISQYIGLSDENGREIYEGDIVSTIYKKPESLGEVVFHQETAAWRIKCKKVALPVVTYRITGDEGGLLIVVKQVIGNIFENPELLIDESKNSVTI